MPPVNKRLRHTVAFNTRRSKESLVSKRSEDYSYEQQKEEYTTLLKLDDQIDHVDFQNDSIMNDISVLFSYCNTQINTRFLSTLVYMSLRRFGHTHRVVDSFLTTVGGLTAKTCQKWTNLLVHNDFDEFIEDERGGKQCDSFWDLHTDLEMEAKDFALQECSKKEATFTAETLPKFIDERFYDLNNLKKAEDKLIRSIESCRLDLRRFGCKYTENKARPYFLGHEREDVVQHREQFVTYFMEHKDHFYTITEGKQPKWVKPTGHPIVLICHDESTYKSGEISAKRWIVEDNAPFYNKGRGRSIMASEFLVMHNSGSFFSLNDKEFKRASNKYPDLNNDSNIIYETQTASATMNIGGNNYFDNETILKQFERLFQLLYFKVAYKDHEFVCLVDNARTHQSSAWDGTVPSRPVPTHPMGLMGWDSFEKCTMGWDGTEIFF
ncbi:unnamed protein product [Rotaria socialis]|uniref:Uncharacterized protein n=1 Tax=Rotaria socialis TaxID=392032 RepID=A0A820TLB8_9BILA|nr:unnamed protein product [Rotaria socialis]CAF4472236.1 unnamed protein product [Rotaria socialis]